MLASKENLQALDNASIEAVKGAKFEPELHNCEPVKVLYTIPLIF